MNRTLGCAVAAAALAAATAASADIAVSVNDGKQVQPGEAPNSRTADHVSVIDLRANPPRAVGMVRAPVSMIGPPASVAVAPDESIAIVSAAQALGSTTPPTLVLDDTLSVIDLSNPAQPRIAQTLKAGPGASGIAINRAGTLALVVSTGDDSINVYSIANRRLTPVGRVRLDYQTRPTDVAIAPDGRSAVAVAQSAGKLVRLAIDGTRVTRTGVEITVGVQPYGAAYAPDGNIVYVTNLGGAPVEPGPGARQGPRLSTVAAVDLRNNTLASSVEVGPTSEHLALSPDGRFLAVVILNGSNGSPSAPNYHPFGLLKVYRVAGTQLTQVAEAQTGAWPQGASWSKDGRMIVTQFAGPKEIAVYRFDGTTLSRDSAQPLKFDARPGALAVGWQR